MSRSPALTHLSVAAAVGGLLGALAGAVRGAIFLAYFGFWAGLMWPLLIGGPLGLLFAARRQSTAGEPLAFAVGAAAGLAPWAWYEWSARGDLNRDEIWFPIALAFLAGSALSPIFVAVRRASRRGSAT